MSVKIKVMIPCRKLSLGQGDGTDAETQVVFRDDGLVQVGGVADGFAFDMDDFLQAVETLYQVPKRPM